MSMDELLFLFIFVKVSLRGSVAGAAFPVWFPARAFFAFPAADCADCDDRFDVSSSR